MDTSSPRSVDLDPPTAREDARVSPRGQPDRFVHTHVYSALYTALTALLFVQLVKLLGAVVLALLLSSLHSLLLMTY